MRFCPTTSWTLVSTFALCLALFPHGENNAEQPQSTNSPKLQNLGPVGEAEAKPSDATPPSASVIDPGVIPTRQSITPAGMQSVFESKVFGVAFGDDGHSVYAVTLGRDGSFVYQMDLETNRMINVTTVPASSGMQGLAFDPVNHAPLLGGLVTDAKGNSTKGQLVAVSGKRSILVADGLGSYQIGGVGVGDARNSSNRRLAVVALTFNDQAAVVDLDTKEVVYRIKTGVAPFTAVVSHDSSEAWVSNWGGRFPRSGERSAPTGPKPGADQVLVDERGLASSGTVTRLDLVTGKATATVAVGLHPSGLAWNESRHLLFVADSNSDEISVVDTAAQRLRETIALQPFRTKTAGISPESAALSPDGNTLYVACSGINAVAVIDVKALHAHVLGYIPTGWYPNDVAVSPDGQYIAASTLLGVGAGWNSPSYLAHEQRYGLKPELNIHRRYVHADRGTVHIIPVPDAIELSRYTVAVAEDSHMNLESSLLAERVAQIKPNPNAPPIPVPVRAGEPSKIDHVIYVIKENRSYDQYLGSLGKGNGDPSLNVFTDDVIPNQRKLAREFVLLDNFYANGGASANGHQWLTQATETDYTYWPGFRGRSYPKNGDDPLAFAGSGFLWDHFPTEHRTFADFGEYVGEMAAAPPHYREKLLDEYKQGSNFLDAFHTKAPIARLNRYLAPDYPAYSLDVPDVVRARIFLRHLRAWEQSGDMPSLVMIQFPSDHTEGVTPGFSTPKACMADNDLAVGELVEGVSHSKFWKSTLILIVEDDAQDGLDHVDGHRTVALAVSPYIRRGFVDSTFYSQVSMVKTIELILGLPHLTLFDLIANDMRQSFQQTPDLRPYDAIMPNQSIYEHNPDLNALRGQAREDALASSRMDWHEPDDVPTDQLNRILWRDAMGSEYPYWKQQAAAFQPGAAH